MASFKSELLDRGRVGFAIRWTQGGKAGGFESAMPTKEIALACAAAPEMLDALIQVQVAFGCLRDGQHYIHPVHGPIAIEELKYLVIDPLLEKLASAIA